MNLPFIRTQSRIHLVRTALNILTFYLLAGYLSADGTVDFSQQFETIRRTATPAQLFTLLYAAPKGGDLHHHIGGDWRMEDLYRVATNALAAEGQRFYTRVRAGDCSGEGNTWVRFATISGHEWQLLEKCQQAEYLPLDQLDPTLRSEWINSLRLDQPGEGRDEFFERIWPRLGALQRDPYVGGEMLVETMKRYGAEGVRYLEPQLIPDFWVSPEGKAIDGEAFYQQIKARLQQPDAVATGVSVRFQVVVIRFLPNAEQRVAAAYDFVDRHRDLFVGINMAGREDNNKGHPRRFLEIYRQMRHRYSGVGLSIHGGEADEPNAHGRDTLLLGATRLGHGVNLITDDDLLLHLRSGIALVEINLVSNLLLEYVKDYREHPFGEYLRTGIPVALSTDDSGMWDSGMTEEYYTAVTEFHLNWTELTSMGTNSLYWSFAEPALKARLLSDYRKAVEAFERQFGGADWQERLKAVHPVAYGYARRRWNLEF